jgi:hypothetical protein
MWASNALVQEIIGARLVLLANTSMLHSQERVTSVILQVPSVNVQQVYAYGEQRGFFKQEELDMRIVVIKPHLATATLLSSFLHETKVVEWRCSG